MADQLIDELLELASDVLIAQPGSADRYGDFVASGDVVTVSGVVDDGSVEMVRRLDGREVASSIRFIALAAEGLTVDEHRYTLPERFEPREDLQAITVDRVSDENGPHHEVIFFP